MKKIVLCAFKDETLCFVHVLLNALDMRERGHDVKLIIEGGAVRQVAAQAREEAPFHGLYEKVKGAGLIDAVCRACAARMGVLAEVESQGLVLKGEMSGHPSLAAYLEQGYEIIVM